MTEPSDFKARLAQLKAQNQEKGYSLSRPVATPPVIAPVSSSPASKGAASQSDTLDDGAKAELRKLDLLGVYVQWFAPQSVRQGGNNEVNVSCFNTDFHRGGDSNPQLGFNTAKNTYYCHACNVTGDIVDLTAVKYGFADAFWKCPDDSVHEAVRYAGEELLGMQFRRTPAGYQRIPEYQPLPVSASPPAQAPVALTLGVFAGQELETGSLTSSPNIPGLTLGNFAVPDVKLMAPNLHNLAPEPYAGPRPEIPAEDDDVTPEIQAGFELNWRDFVPHGTPLGNYLEIVCQDDSPEEFHFWNFMSLIGLAMGRKVFLPDVKPVYGNMLLCLIGRTGQGKSRSEGYISELIRTAMPFDEANQYTNGVRIVKNPGSGEYLAAAFKHEVPDPIAITAKGKKAPTLTNPSVKALIRWPEMATMVGKSSSRGSIIQTTVIDLYDTPDAIGGGSLTHGSYEAKNPFGSVTTTTQLSQVRRLVTTDDASSGFLNRWWFIIGKTKQFEPWGSYVNIGPLKHDVEMLVKWSEDKFRSSNGFHNMSKDALAVASEFLVSRCAPLEASEHDEMLRRAVLTFKKLILLFSANMLEQEVSVNAVNQAKVAFEYLISCMQHIGVKVGQTDFEIAIDDVNDAIAKSGQEGVTPRDLKRILKRKTKQSAENIDAHLRNMEQSGRIELRVTPQPAGRVGRPTKRYFLCDD